MDDVKVMVRGSAMKPYACFAVGAYPNNRVVIWRQGRSTLIPVPAVDVFEFNQSLYDELVIAFDDCDEQSLREAWTRADRFNSASMLTTPGAGDAGA